MPFEKIFPADRIPKRERVELTLRHSAVDRVAILDQVSYNPAVVAAYTGKPIDGFNYGADEIGAVIRQTLDLCMVPASVHRCGPVSTCNGFVIRYDHWHSWIESRPFKDEQGAREWLIQRTHQLREQPFQQEQCRAENFKAMLEAVGELPNPFFKEKP